MAKPPDDPMRYGLLGEDARSTAERLAKYTGEVDWPYLRPHFESGALFYVDPALALERVGAALSDDDRPRVEAWLKSGDLVKVGDLHAAHWDEANPRMTALVVTPFVLCQPATT